MKIIGSSSTLLDSAGWQWQEGGSEFAHFARFVSEACARVVYSGSWLVSEVGDVGVVDGVMMSFAWTFRTSRMQMHSRAFAMHMLLRFLWTWMFQARVQLGSRIRFPGDRMKCSKSLSWRMGWQKSVFLMIGRRRNRSAI